MKSSPAPHPDDARLLPGSLGLNREWTILKNQRRLAGGEPISFYRGRTKRAVYADLTATQATLERTLRHDAMDRSDLGSDVVTSTSVTITEYARRKGMGARKAREIMGRLSILQQEIEVRVVPMIVNPGHTKPDYRATLRLASWAVLEGLGRRMKSREGVAFDVLTEDGVAWLDARWPSPVEKPQAKRGRPSSLRETVQRLLAEGKSQAETARILGKSRQTVSHHAKALAAAALDRPLRSGVSNNSLSSLL